MSDGGGEGVLEGEEGIMKKKMQFSHFFRYNFKYIDRHLNKVSL